MILLPAAAAGVSFGDPRPFPAQYCLWPLPTESVLRPLFLILNITRNKAGSSFPRTVEAAALHRTELKGVTGAHSGQMAAVC